MIITSLMIMPVLINKGMLQAAFVLLCLGFACVCARAGLAQLEQRESSLCAALIVPQRSYSCQEFTVKTNDGFLLGVQRVAAVSKNRIKKTPVFLMHGTLSGGDTWVLNSPSQSLAFILADAGYDVWIGNSRTTDFSHGHVVYTEIDKDYWDWSLDELAEKDLVAMLELVYTTTGLPAHYIGYSQGTQAAFAALSEGRLVNWLDKVVMMAPVAYLKHVPNSIVILGTTLRLDQVLGRLKFYSFGTKTPSGKQLVDLICAPDSGRCYNTWAKVFTGDNCCINDTRRPFYDQYETQATSSKNLHHLGQLCRQGTFAKYDYGVLGNMQRYKSFKPPAYDLTKIETSKMLLIYGQKDALSDVTDVLELCSQLPQGYRSLLVEDYAHIDFIIGYNANTKVYSEILKFLEQ